MKEFQPKKLSKKELEEAEQLGGADFNNYRNNQTPYCDKGGHKQRSIANQPNHKNHWKK